MLVRAGNELTLLSVYVGRGHLLDCNKMFKKKIISLTFTYIYIYIFLSQRMRKILQRIFSTRYVGMYVLT